jgi:hypothetical protein
LKQQEDRRGKAMKLEISMTDRDKKLLIFLGIFVIVVCFAYWGIRPSIKSVMSINEDIQDDNKTLEENIVEARANYFAMMTSDEIDKYFTGLALSYNLYSYDLNISMPSDTCDLEPYQYSAKALMPDTDEEDEEEDTDDSSDDLLDEEEDPDTGIYAATVTLRLGGEQENLTTFVDDLSNTDQKIRICKYSYSTNQNVISGTDGTYDVVESTVLNITVEIYMCLE